MAPKPFFLTLFLIYSTGFSPENVWGAVDLDEKTPPLLDYGTMLDNEAKGNLKVEVKLKEKISYFGGSYQTAYILKDGLIAFEPDVEYQKDIIWAEGVRNYLTDKPFMAPFLHNGYNPSSMAEGEYQGKIFYRTIYKSDLKPTVYNYNENLQLLKNLEEYVQEAVIDPPKNFAATTLLIVTWENVTDMASSEADDCERTPAKPCKAATFQAVIVASKTESIAIFNYKKMDIPYQKSYQSGFNGGYGRGWFNVIPCHGECSKNLNVSRVNELPNLTGSDLKGRYVLKVGQESIVRGGCLPTPLTAGMLEVYPTTVGMFGGEMLQVSGKCFSARSKIYCKFGVKHDSPVTEGKMVNSMKGFCPVPILTTREPISVMWSEDGENWVADGFIDVALPERLDKNKDVEMINRKQWYADKSSSITVQWTPSELSENANAQVEVNLIGYREDDTDGTVEFKVLKNLGSVNNQQSQLSVDVSTYRCKSDCEKYELGLLEVTLSKSYYDTATDRYAVRYGPIPIGWYVNQELTSSLGANWINQKCQAWYDQDKENTDWMTGLPACPCNLDQAVADFGRWQPGRGCNMFTGTDCVHHTTAIHCVRSVEATSKGAGSQCCYDANRQLIYSQLSTQGSTPDRSHAWGASPFKKPNFVPELSHWRHDVVPFYYCCVWNKENCDLYTRLRPTSDCKNYDVPGIGALSGDPHIRTFDGQMYNFGGKGDFWLVKSRQLQLQGRFAESPGVWDLGKEAGQTPFKPTALTYLTLQGNGVILEFQTAPKDSVIPRGLDIRVGEDRKFFLTKSTMWQDFRGYSIFNNDRRERGNPHNNFTILVKDNVGVNIAAINDLLYVTVSLPPTMKVKDGKVTGMGLMGMFDGKNGNDFVDVSGSVLTPGTPKPQLYQNFAMSWSVLSKDTLFPYHTPVDAKYTPIFEYKDIPSGFKDAPTEARISAACQDSESCKWDYKITGNRDIALATKAANQRVDFQRSSATIVKTCGLPDVGRNAVLTSSNFTQDSEVTVTGCGPHMEFSGQLSLKCVTETLEDAKVNARDHYGIKSVMNNSVEYITHWVPEPHPVCTEESNDESEDAELAMIIGISVGVVVLIIIIIIIIIVVVKRKSNKSERKESPTTRNKRNRDPQSDPGAAETMLSSSNRNPVYKPSDQTVRIGSNV